MKKPTYINDYAKLRQVVLDAWKDGNCPVEQFTQITGEHCKQCKALELCSMATGMLHEGDADYEGL